MKNRRNPAHTATSLEKSPQDDETSRMRQYLISMAIRTACVVAMFAWQPFGWHTAILAVGGVFLPYFAVVIANQSMAGRVSRAERPEIQIAPTASGAAPATGDDRVIRLEESPRPGEAAT
ncbi:DUF3099 domain-containing protein [Microbacterium indicum]|uniref:DUF3099 domain-containing protein n=1 Tax=Microbacterium indicum TaxID=358100 RepID=UPI0003FD44CD|nr:DUF3099 domain-containing protein [Microbacterium indicum]